MKKALVWGATIAVLVRLALLAIGAPEKLSRSIEISTPVTSLRRLAEGLWLKRLGLSPYAGNAYHGSPLLLQLLGPLNENSPLFFLILDLGSALCLLLIGKILSAARKQHSSALKLPLDEGGDMDIGEVAALLYLFNPFTILVSVGGSTSPLENFLVFLALYASISGNIPLASFGWVLASHLSLYPVMLLVPIAIALNGPDGPPQKLFKLRRGLDAEKLKIPSPTFNWWLLFRFLFWSAVWFLAILWLCNHILNGQSGFSEMMKETHGFIISVGDLTPNLGIFWYFFTEVFHFFRPFFLLVFHGTLACMLAPLTIRFHHRPMFLAFVLLAASSALKSYPSLGDAALYLGMMPLFLHELSAGFRYSYLLLNGYICVTLLSPIMYNLWIWRATGNANFYFAASLVYAIVQTILIVESISSVLRYECNLKVRILGETKSAMK